MKRSPFATWTIAATLVLTFASLLSGQKPAAPDLKGIPNGSGWTTINRAVKVIEQDGRVVAEFDAKPGDGMARLEGLSFTTGEIECDIQGRSVPVQGSFVGLAFGVQSPETYEAVYVRPFNFRSEDPARRAHSVQYIAHPDWTWSRLRQERPGQFESALEPAPDGDSWIHVRVVVGATKIEVYVDSAAVPCLTVDRLAGARAGAVALWVGNGSPGKFANLKIKS
jgi:hypothetical protein